MKRLLLAALVSGACLTGLVLLRPAPIAGQNAANSYGPTEPCPATCCKEKGHPCCEAAKKKDDAVIVAELVKILGETKNSDTFVATVLALGQFDDKSPLPVVVRNAARLGLLKGMAKDENTTRLQQLLAAYLSGEMTAESNPEFVQHCRAPYPLPMPMPAPHWYGPQPPQPVTATCVPAPYYGSCNVMPAPTPSLARPPEFIRTAPKCGASEECSPYTKSITAPKDPESKKDR